MSTQLSYTHVVRENEKEITKSLPVILHCINGPLFYGDINESLAMQRQAWGGVEGKRIKSLCIIK